MWFVFVQSSASLGQSVTIWNNVVLAESVGPVVVVLFEFNLSPCSLLQADDHHQPKNF